ncbi:Flagellar motor switch protein [gamma proteobacterium HdN1]|nr:Flagellar motor switch protein [gamma proteobacterium HdN1]
MAENALEKKGDLPALDPIDKSAILLLSLGEDNAAEVLKHMGPKEVQKIGVAMARMQNVEKAQVEAVIEEFLEIIKQQTALGMGSEGYIKRMLVSALGEDKAGALIDRILAGGNTAGLDTLRWMDARAISNMIRFEHPQIQAIVLAYLDPDQSAEVLGYFEERVRLDVVLRIASLESVQPHALQELNDILEKQFSSQATSASRQLGGTKVAADIMNFLDTSVESTLMESIRDVDENLASRIQDLMFVFDNLIDVDDRGIQTLLREVSSEVLILALKGSDEAVRDKIFGNMSKRAAELLRDDLETRGPVKVSEVEGAQKEILAIARRMAESGEITLGGKGGDEMI